MLTSADPGLLVLRLRVGGIPFAHGAQQLWSWFGGRSMAAHTDNVQRMGFRPPRVWASMNACSQFFGGLGLVFGLLTPLVAGGVLGSMLVAIIKVHWKKGFWNSAGGADPVTPARQHQAR